MRILGIMPLIWACTDDAAVDKQEGGENNIPTCSITEPADGTSVVVGNSVIFRGLANDEDVPATSLSYMWQSDKDGDLGTGSIGSDGEILFPYSGLTVEEHAITLLVEDELGAICQDTLFLSVGSLPLATITEPIDGAVYSQGDLITFRGVVSDQEDQSNEITATWTSGLDGELHNGLVNSQGDTEFSSSNLSAGMHSVTLSATDTSGLMYDSLILIRVNTHPIVDSITLSPMPIHSNETLSVSVSVSDVDGDTVTSSYAWYENGVLTGFTETTISASELDLGETWTVRVTPNDGFVDGAYLEESITVTNTDPTITSAQISSSDGSNVYNDSVLTCSATASDTDGQTLNYTYSWMIDGSSYSGVSQDLSNMGIQPTASVECIATVADTNGGTAQSSATLTIDNRAPSVDTVSISPNTEVLNDSELTCLATVSDPDDESLNPTYEWFVSGASIGISNVLQLSNSLVVPNNSVECVATVNDGFGDSDSDSSSVTISNRAPSSPTVSITWTGTTVVPRELDDLTCSATGSIDPDGQTVTYSYEWTSDSGTIVSGATVSSSETLDSDLWTCTATASDGSLSAQASETVEIIGSNSWSNCSTTQTLNGAEFQFLGENTPDGAGYSVSSAGDVDGDGLDDILIGAYRNADGGNQAGKSYLILGSSLGGSSIIGLSLADYSFIGEDAADQAGISVSSAGDVDGDGLDDILIGARYNDDGGTDAGKSYLILGSSLGSSSTIDLSNADYSFIGEAVHNYSGTSVSSAGDVDGDGLSDILIGAYGNSYGGSQAGRSYLILGSSLGSSSTIDLSNADYAFIGENAVDRAGLSVSSAGDVDGDGLSDILIGAYGNADGGTNAGKSYLILGSSLGGSSIIDLSLADYAFIGENAQDRAGLSVSSAGDVDGDGLFDILIGAFYNDDGGTDVGEVGLFKACPVP